MAQPPVFTYGAKKLQPGVDLTLTGVGTPNLTATYGDYGGYGEPDSLKATCVISINYSDIAYTINNDNSITVTGKITGAQLVRTFVASSSNSQEVIVWFDGQQVFRQTFGTSQAGTWNLNIPATFSVTIPPSNNPQTQWPASIHYLNHNTNNPWPDFDPDYPPDEFNFGLGILNPNPPDYRPGAILDGSSLWQSHNRTGGTSHILTGGGTWAEMRTEGGLGAYGNPPAIRYQDKWSNMREIGKE